MYAFPKNTVINCDSIVYTNLVSNRFMIISKYTEWCIKVDKTSRDCM